MLVEAVYWRVLKILVSKAGVVVSREKLNGFLRAKYKPIDATKENAANPPKSDAGSAGTEPPAKSAEISMMAIPSGSGAPTATSSEASKHVGPMSEPSNSSGKPEPTAH